MNLKKKLKELRQKQAERTEEAIQQDYNMVAANIGHRMRIRDEVEEEILTFQAQLKSLSEEAKAAKARRLKEQSKTQGVGAPALPAPAPQPQPQQPAGNA